MQPHIGKRPWARPLADFVDGCLSPALARYGFGEAAIVTHWRDIVGARIAARAEPSRLRWRRSPRHDAAATPPATLVLRVEGGFALELQHLAPLIVERVNTHLGWRCVGRLDLRGGPLTRRGGAAPPPPAPDPEAARSAAAATAGIDDAALRSALVRLGARALKPPRSAAPAASSPAP